MPAFTAVKGGTRKNNCFHSFVFFSRERCFFFGSHLDLKHCDCVVQHLYTNGQHFSSFTWGCRRRSTTAVHSSWSRMTVRHFGTSSHAYIVDIIHFFLICRLRSFAQNSLVSRVLSWPFFLIQELSESCQINICERRKRKFLVYNLSLFTFDEFSSWSRLRIKFYFNLLINNSSSNFRRNFY